MTKYEYNSETALSYSELGIAGTSYEAGFEKAAQILGNLKDMIVLDFGCGTGRSSRFLLSLGATKVIGVDHNQSMIDNATTENIPNAEFLYVANDIPLSDASCDIAFSSWAFMEMNSLLDIKTAIHKISKVIKNGSRLVVIVTNPDAAFGHDYVNFKYLDSPATLHSGDKTRLTIKTSNPFIIEDYYWTLEDYTTALAEAGFTIENVHYPKPADGNRIDEQVVPAHMIIEAILR